ncbi:MAG: prepilin-type N-terminal cleavage/methylation domain-containing protein [Phycisphaerales bacterium]|jgi:prepilin-type N-terminal cleavage/methylation domain-containing protein
MPSLSPMLSRHTLPMICALVLAAVFAFSAIAKTINANEFSVVIDAMLAASVDPSPEVAKPLRVMISAMIVGWEVLLVVILVVPKFRRIAAVSSVATLVAFSGALVFMMLAGIKDCGCFGGEAPWVGSDENASMMAGLLRNAGLIMMAMLAWAGPAALPPGSELETDSDPQQPRQGHNLPRAFSIIELLVVISIIALLLAISLPALSGARVTAIKGKELATHRQLVAALHMYAEANDGYPPYVNVPGQPFTPSPLLAEKLGFVSYFRAHTNHWMLPLVIGEYIPAELVVMPGHDVPLNPCEPFDSTFFFSQAFAAEPRFWVGERTPPEMSLLRGVKLDSVTFPAQKGIIANASWTDRGSMEYDGMWTVAFSDGSARRKDHYRVTLSRAYGSRPWVVMTTENGVYGLDYP